MVLCNSEGKHEEGHQGRYIFLDLTQKMSTYCFNFFLLIQIQVVIILCEVFEDY